MTGHQRSRLEAWIAAERAAGRLRTQTVYGVACAATKALGFAVDHRDAATAWNSVLAAERRAKGAVPA